MSTGLVTLALLVSAPGPTGLGRGDEFTFCGTVAEHANRPESSNRPGQCFHREYELCLRVMVLEREESWCDVAVLTSLQRTEDAVGGAAQPVTGRVPFKNAPPLVHLNLVRVHSDGTLNLLFPQGARLKLGSDTSATGVNPLPLDTFSAVELGIFPPRIPLSANSGEPWRIAAGANRPDELWIAKKMEFINAEQCQMLVMNQQSPDWEKPVGGQTSWHRADAVWVSTQDGMARKVHRVIRQRDGREAVPAAWIEAKYQLKDHEKLSGRTYDQARRDIEVAYFALAEAPILISGLPKLGPRLIEDRLAKLDTYLAENKPGTAYQEAIHAAKRTLDAARHGNVASPLITPIGTAVAPRATWPEPGLQAPEIRYGDSALSSLRGKPVVVVFFRPEGATTDLSLAVADAILKRYNGAVEVVALCVFGDVAAAVKDRDRLKLTIPIHNGSNSAGNYGVETVPRFALIDAQGKVKWTFTGVGAETGGMLKDEVDRMVRPALPISPSGTIPALGPPMTPPMPRP